MSGERNTEKGPDDSHQKSGEAQGGRPDTTSIRGYDFLTGVWLAAATALGLLNVLEVDVSRWIAFGLFGVVLALAPFMLRRAREKR
jgi:hypothetical protein